MAGSSEAGRSFRQWARQREVEQSDQLKQIERAVARIDEVDADTTRSPTKSLSRSTG